MAGQIVAEGFLEWHVPLWIQRLATRLCAIVPALVIVLAAGASGLNFILILSQVILSMCLVGRSPFFLGACLLTTICCQPFAVFPLVYFSSDKKVMARYANHWAVKWLGYSVAIIMAGMNIYLLIQTGISGGLVTSPGSGSSTSAN